MSCVSVECFVCMCVFLCLHLHLYFIDLYIRLFFVCASISDRVL